MALRRSVWTVLGTLGILGCGNNLPPPYSEMLDVQFTRIDGGVRLPDGFIIYDDAAGMDIVRQEIAPTDNPPVDAVIADTGDGGVAPIIDAGGIDVVVPEAGPPPDNGPMMNPDVISDVVDVNMEDVERCTPAMNRFCRPSDGIPETVYGRGICRRGTQVCNEMGRWNDCVGQVDPRPGGEVCNNLDDNCDGIVDNLYRECGNGPCRVRRLICVLGREVMCEQNAAMRRSELCNGADDDCDGFIDEREDNTGNLAETCFTYPPQFNGVGICASGTRICADAGWSPCDDTIPQPELCNGLDDDCDGMTDNNCTDR